MSEQHELAIVFDGPPGPVSGRFLEVELDGKGIGFGKWWEGAVGIWKLILPEPYTQLAVIRQTLDKWDSELASTDEIAGHAALLIISDLRSLLDDIPEINDLDLSDRIGQFLFPLLKDGVLSVTDIREGHDIQRQVVALEISERTAVVRVNDAEVKLSKMEEALNLMLASPKDRLEYCKANGLLPSIITATESVDPYWREAIAKEALAVGDDDQSS